MIMKKGGCHMSPVNFFLNFFLLNFFLQSCGAGWWRVCYQRGLPHLVFIWVEGSRSKMTKWMLRFFCYLYYIQWTLIYISTIACENTVLNQSWSSADWSVTHVGILSSDWPTSLTADITDITADITHMYPSIWAGLSRVMSRLPAYNIWTFL